MVLHYTISIYSLLFRTHSIGKIETMFAKVGLPSWLTGRTDADFPESARAIYANLRTLCCEFILECAPSFGEEDPAEFLALAERAVSIPQLVVLLQRLWLEVVPLDFQWDSKRQQAWLTHLLLIVEAAREGWLNFYGASLLYLKCFAELMDCGVLAVLRASAGDAGERRSESKSESSRTVRFAPEHVDPKTIPASARFSSPRNGRTKTRTPPHQTNDEDFDAATGVTKIPDDSDCTPLSSDLSTSHGPPGSSSALSTSQIAELILEHSNIVLQFLEQNREVLVTVRADLEFTGDDSSLSLQLPPAASKALGMWPERRVEGRTASYLGATLTLLPGSLAVATGVVGGIMLYNRVMDKSDGEKLERAHRELQAERVARELKAEAVGGLGEKGMEDVSQDLRRYVGRATTWAGEGRGVQLRGAFPTAGINPGSWASSSEGNDVVHANSAVDATSTEGIELLPPPPRCQQSPRREQAVAASVFSRGASSSPRSDENRFLNPLRQLAAKPSRADVALAKLEVVCAERAEHLLKRKIFPML